VDATGVDVNDATGVDVVGASYGVGATYGQNANVAVTAAGDPEIYPFSEDNADCPWYSTF
jgi:hypothetical protein